MAGSKIKISRDRARAFAYIIYRDVAAYVESHQEEYQKFVLTEEDAFNGKDKATHRSKRHSQKANRE